MSEGGAKWGEHLTELRGRLLGNEHSGLPQEVRPFLDQVVEIPMMGLGSSLNVAVAGSLVLYKLAGLS
jgi:tRNA (guanosine-2'-O-)-methyltransferase